MSLSHWVFKVKWQLPFTICEGESIELITLNLQLVHLPPYILYFNKKITLKIIYSIVLTRFISIVGSWLAFFFSFILSCIYQIFWANNGYLLNYVLKDILKVTSYWSVYRLNGMPGICVSLNWTRWGGEHEVGGGYKWSMIIVEGG